MLRAIVLMASWTVASANSGLRLPMTLSHPEPRSARCLSVKTSGTQILARHQREMKVFRHNTDDGVGLSIQLDDFVVQFRFEPLSPQPITDDGYMGRFRLVLAVKEVTPAANCTPSVRKKSAVTRAPSIRSGIVPPVRLNSSRSRLINFQKRDSARANPESPARKLLHSSPSSCPVSRAPPSGPDGGTKRPQ